LGAGLIVSSTSKFSKKLKISPFAFSFIFLGLLTSTPELSVGLQAVINHDTNIFVGNLLGGIVVLFLVIIPLLAIFGNGINLKHELSKKMLLITMGVIIAPSIVVLDNRVTSFEGAVLIVLYLILLFFVERHHGIFDKHNTKMLNMKAYSYKDIINILVGLIIVFVSSNVIVDKTIYFANTFHVSAFYISLIIVALGTDLPELSLAIRSVASGNKDIAMGDYVGAAAVSTFLFGLFTVLSNGEIITINNFFVTFIFIIIALSLFYYFSLEKNFISRKNGFIMISIYVLFVILEIVK
jgi:cation:H+ antiporter